MPSVWQSGTVLRQRNHSFHSSSTLHSFTSTGTRWLKVKPISGCLPPESLEIWEECALDSIDLYFLHTQCMFPDSNVVWVTYCISCSLSFWESTVFSLYISSLCVILSSLATTIFDLPEPYEKSFWGQWKYAHKYSADCVNQAHTRIDWKPSKPSKEVEEHLGFCFFFFVCLVGRGGFGLVFLKFLCVCVCCWFFFVVWYFFFLFPWGMWWFILAETCLWLSLGSSMCP